MIIVALAVTAFLFTVYFALLVATGRKKDPKPGRDFDERGPYDFHEDDEA